MSLALDERPAAAPTLIVEPVLSRPVSPEPVRVEPPTDALLAAGPRFSTRRAVQSLAALTLVLALVAAGVELGLGASDDGGSVVATAGRPGWWPTPDGRDDIDDIGPGPRVPPYPDGGTVIDAAALAPPSGDAIADVGDAGDAIADGADAGDTAGADDGDAPVVATAGPSSAAPSAAGSAGPDDRDRRSSPTVPGPSPSSPTPTSVPTNGPPTTAAPAAITPTAPVTPTPTAATAPTAAGGGGQLVWAEEFDVLDPARWAVEHSTYGDGNGELQCYRPRNVSVAGGKLVLRAVTETYTCPNGSTRQLTSGMVRSRGLTLAPGQAIEVRVKLTPADESDQGGLWPAVWASSWAPGGWPRGGELDVLEVMTANDPARSIYSIHFARPDGSHGVVNRPVYGDRTFSADWHTVRFDYGHGGRLAWYLDGRLVHSVAAADTIQGYPAPFDQSIEEIKINLALGGRPGPLSPNAVGTTGATFEIDYVRVFRL
jgi:beta-glucanase (GH16 family)